MDEDEELIPPPTSAPRENAEVTSDVPVEEFTSEEMEIRPLSEADDLLDIFE